MTFFTTVHFGRGNHGHRHNAYSNPFRNHHGGRQYHVAPRRPLFSFFRPAPIISFGNPRPAFHVHRNPPLRIAGKINLIFSKIMMGAFLGAVAGAIIFPNPVSVVIGAATGAMAGGLMGLGI